MVSSEHQLRVQHRHSQVVRCMEQAEKPLVTCCSGWCALGHVRAVHGMLMTVQHHAQCSSACHGHRGTTCVDWRLLLLVGYSSTSTGHVPRRSLRKANVTISCIGILTVHRHTVMLSAAHQWHSHRLMHGSVTVWHQAQQQVTLRAAVSTKVPAAPKLCCWDAVFLSADSRSAL